MKIEFVTEPDETDKGRVIVDGKFYGLPVDAVRELMETRDTLMAIGSPGASGAADVNEFDDWWESQNYYEEAQVWLARQAWDAALTRAIEIMPGGSVVDPQWVCDKLRELGGTRGG